MNVVMLSCLFIFVLMYLEGLLILFIAINFSQLESKLIKIIAVLIWPLAMPYLAYKAYTKYRTYMSMFLNFEGFPNLPGEAPLEPISLDALDEIQKQFETILAQQEVDNPNKEI